MDETPSQRVEVIEVGPRDGLQNEREIFSVEDKLNMVEKLIAAGVKRLEVGSFVNPKKVPQMAGTETLVERLPQGSDVTYIGLVLNLRGLERALDTAVHEIGAVALPSNTFAQKNQGQSSQGSVAVASDILQRANSAGRKANVTISAAFGCPFEGEIDPHRIVDMAVALADAGPHEIAIADTIGVADPWRVSELFAKLKTALPDMPLRAHFHNTRNTGLANAFAAVQAGVARLDASLGGIGGCPFAPAATGNIPTEDLVYMLSRGGFETDLFIDALVMSAQWLESLMGKTIPSMVAKAGGFPDTDHFRKISSAA